MNSAMIIEHMQFIRSITLHSMKHITAEWADLQPKGFNNTLRWNIGHILTIQEQLSHHYIGDAFHLPAVYPEMFGNGSKPADWQQAAPSLDELATLLQAQTNRLGEALVDRLDEPVEQSFVRFKRTMNTVGEVLLFSIYHEGVHIGIINGMKHAIEGQFNS